MHMGHVDIIERASRIFDEVIIAIAVNIDKNPLFTVEERMDLAIGATSHLKNIKALSTDGLIADFAKTHKACGLIRGLRHVSDFEFEFQLALMNRKLNEEIETIFMMPRESYTFLSSRLVKEIAKLGGNISAFVTPNIERRLKERLA